MQKAAILLAAVIVGSAALPTTTEPSWAPTGRLSQFRGFGTPRPSLEDDVNMMYASVWAAWSAWSFCSNGARMRVRACNTVKGFSCLGPNQETRPCDVILPPSGHERKQTTDYDVVDPWEADRQEAMKQLYPDDPEPPVKETNNLLQLSPSRPRPPTPRISQLSRDRIVDHTLVGFEDRRPANEADGSPGVDPERLFGAKQFAVKSIIPDEFKETKDIGSEELNRLVPMNTKSSDEIDSIDKEDQSSFDDITFDATTVSIPSDRDEKISKVIGEEISGTQQNGEEVIDKTFEEAEVIGDHPVRVQPQLPPSAIDDNLEDLLEVTQPLIEKSFSLSTVRPEKTFGESVIPQRETARLSLAETDLMNAVKIRADNDGKEMKLIHENKLSKKKSFGFTGFALKKPTEKFSVSKLHDGEVYRAIASAILPVTTTTTTTLPPVIHPAIHPVEQVPEISMDTLNALDWMLKNMTQAADKEDNEFFKAFPEVAIPPREIVKESFPISSSEPTEAEPVKLLKQRKLKRKKMKKGKKAEIIKLHDGEYTPMNFDRTKMFPKFKARQMKIHKTRALGVRTVNSEKDRIDLTKESLMQGQNPDQIFQEVRQLQQEMQLLEKQLETYDKNVPLKDNILHDGARIELLSSKVSPKKEPLPQSQPTLDSLRILTPIETTLVETKWGDWSTFGPCFCGIQVRTRVCHYGAASAGCKGPSHESRICTGGVCPSKTSQTGVLEYNGGPLRPRRQP